MAYYVYTYVNVDKPTFLKCKTSVGEFSFDYEPVYIGKSYYLNGKGTIQSHDDDLKQFLKNGNYDCYEIIGSLPSHLAYKLETELIYYIGRLDLGRGPLFNKSCGVYLVESAKTANIGPYHLEFNKLIWVLEALNKSKSLKDASKILGISERTLYRYNKAYCIERAKNGEWIQITS